MNPSYPSQSATCSQPPCIDPARPAGGLMHVGLDLGFRRGGVDRPVSEAGQSIDRKNATGLNGSAASERCRHTIAGLRSFGAMALEPIGRTD